MEEKFDLVKFNAFFKTFKFEKVDYVDDRIAIRFSADPSVNSNIKTSKPIVFITEEDFNKIYVFITKELKAF